MIYFCIINGILVYVFILLTLMALAQSLGARGKSEATWKKRTCLCLAGLAWFMLTNVATEATCAAAFR